MNTIPHAVEAYIGLGSNLGDSITTLKSACRAIAQPDSIHLLALSPFYRSKPVGPQDQPDYINAVLRIGTTLSAESLLNHLQDIENRHGRERTLRWGPRTLDLDILLYADILMHSDRLTIPHPELHRRNFVLYPLLQVAPANLLIPGFENSLAALVAGCSDLGLEKIDA